MNICDFNSIWNPKITYNFEGEKYRTYKYKLNVATYLICHFYFPFC